MNLAGRCNMTSSEDTLKDRLARYRQIKLSVIGRKSGKTISIPVWFVLEGEKLYLLPVKGSDTQQNAPAGPEKPGTPQKRRALVTTRQLSPANI
jgi:hypothetical protein